MIMRTLIITQGSQGAEKHCKEQLAPDKGIICGKLEQAGSLDLGNVLKAAGLLIVRISILYAVGLRCSSTTSERAGVIAHFRDLLTEQM